MCILFRVSKSVCSHGTMRTLKIGMARRRELRIYVAESTFCYIPDSKEATCKFPGFCGILKSYKQLALVQVVKT